MKSKRVFIHSLFPIHPTYHIGNLPTNAEHCFKGPDAYLDCTELMKGISHQTNQSVLFLSFFLFFFNPKQILTVCC